MSVELKAKQSISSAFLDANAQKLFWGQLISQACDKIMSVGLIWVLATRFDPKWIPCLIGIGALPHFLLAFHSGKWVSRWGPLRTVIRADAFRGLLFLACAWLLPYVHTDSHLLALLLLASLLSNVAGSLFNPAILSLPVAIMEAGDKRNKLTALIDSCFSFGNVLGPLVAAATYSIAGLKGMLAINGLSYLFSSLLASGIKLETSIYAKGGEGNNSPSFASKNVFSVLKKEPVIPGMLIGFLLMNFFLAPLMIFMPWYAKNIYGAGISGFARLEFFLGTGTLAGGALLSFVQVPGGTGGFTWKRITFCLSLMGAAYLLFTFSRDLLLGCLSVAILGFFLAMANIFILNFFQSSPREEDVPTVMGMVNFISVATLPISMGIMGTFIEKLPVQNFAIACAAILIAIAISIRLIPGIERV